MLKIEGLLTNDIKKNFDHCEPIAFKKVKAVIVGEEVNETLEVRTSEMSEKFLEFGGELFMIDITVME